MTSTEVSDFRTLIEDLEQCTEDSARVTLVKDHCWSNPHITHEQIIAIIGKFMFDVHRLNALAFIAPNIKSLFDPEPLAIMLNTFNHDINRVEAIKLLQRNITPIVMMRLIMSFTMPRNFAEALSIIQTKHYLNEDQDNASNDYIEEVIFDWGKKEVKFSPDKTKKFISDKYIILITRMGLGRNFKFDISTIDGEYNVRAVISCPISPIFVHDFIITSGSVYVNLS